MLERAVRRGVAFLLLVLPVPLLAQGLTIDHKPVGCIVAEKYPKLNACFSPAGQLARARVYFRPEDGPPNWYYVEMKSDALCHAGTLPKPKKELIGKKVLYYVNAFDQKFAENRTVDNEALVVKSESECKKDVPVAPFAASAPAAVFPAVPAGFAAAGIGTGAVVAAVAGGAAVVGGGVALATKGNNPPATTQPAPPPTTLPATVPTTTATTLAAVPFNPVYKVSSNGVLQTAFPIAGQEPLPLRFDMCQSTGPLPLRFSVLVNGGLVTAGCDSTITFTSVGVSARVGGVAASTNRVRASAATSYNVVMLIESVGPGNNPKDQQALTVNVSAPTPVPTPTPTPCPSPTVTLVTPMAGDTWGPPLGYSIPFTATAADPGGIASVQYFLDVPMAPLTGYSAGSSTSGPTYPVSLSGQTILKDIFNKYTFPPSSVPPCSATALAYAVALNTCGLSTTSAKVSITIGRDTPSCIGSPIVLRAPQPGAWVSQFDVPGGRGQVVLNGCDVLFPAAGRVLMAGRLVSGENRVEATLVQATGQPGTWRFELGASAKLVPGSLRVVAGRVAQVSDGTIVFQLSGRSGERVVFTFRTGD
jgi:hypothetical protein